MSRAKSWQAIVRQTAAAERRQERAERARARELNRMAKEEAKLSALEQARLEVERHETEIDLLLSVHKEQGPEWDWHAVAAAPAPLEPVRSSRHEIRGLQHERLTAFGVDCRSHPGYLGSAAHGRIRDETEHRRAVESYEDARETRRLEQALAGRILKGEVQAFQEALEEMAPFDSISDFCADV